MPSQGWQGRHSRSDTSLHRGRALRPSCLRALRGPAWAGWAKRGDLRHKPFLWAQRRGMGGSRDQQGTQGWHLGPRLGCHWGASL